MLKRLYAISHRPFIGAPARDVCRWCFARPVVGWETCEKPACRRAWLEVRVMSCRTDKGVMFE